MSNPPGPKGHFLLGHWPQFRDDTLKFLGELQQLGDLTHFRFGPFPAYFTGHPDLIHQVLVTDADKMHKSRATKLVMKQVVGEGLFTSDGVLWKRQRKLAQPAFHSKRIGAYADVMVDFAHKMLDQWQPGQVHDIGSEMSGVTMNIISKTLFDAELEADLLEIQEAILTALKIIDQRFNRLIPFPDWVPTARNRQMTQAVVTMDRIIHRFINDRRVSGEDKGDLLSMLLAAQDDEGIGMTDKQLRDECMTLFGAGHETTAVTLMWALYALSQHPELEARLHAEVDQVLGDRPATLADLNELKFTDMFIKETLRYYPPAWGSTRENIAPVTINGYTLPANSIIVLGIYHMHHNPRWWDEPEMFNPERFSSENEKKVHKYAYLPFGAGPRVCIGNMFASMEARLILATIAQRYQLRLAPGQVVVPERVFTLRPKYGLHMIPQPRQKQPTADAALSAAV